MLNAEPPPASANQEENLAHIIGSGPIGAATLAELATAIVLAIWLVFYLFIFAPRNLP
jgi:hypothetical protein